MGRMLEALTPHPCIRRRTMTMTSNHLLMLLLIIATIRGEKACQQPPKGPHFIQENLADDIVMTIVSTAPDTALLWSVTGLEMQGATNAGIVVDRLKMQRKGPFWNLVTTRGIAIPEGEQDGIMKLMVELECLEIGSRGEINGEVHSLPLVVFPRPILEKIQVTVPENLPVHQSIYLGKDTSNKMQASYKHFPTSNTLGSDGSAFFHLNRVTGSVTVSRPLDYENGPKVMWLVAIKDTGSSSDKSIRLFRIEIANVNDNAPGFLRNKTCQGKTGCKTTHYEFTIDTQKDGSTPSNKAVVYAADVDGDVIEYAIIEVRPKVDLFTIHKESGDIKCQSDKAHHASRYYLIVQASDGVHSTYASVSIDLLGGDPKSAVVYTSVEDRSKQDGSLKQVTGNNAKQSVELKKYLHELCSNLTSVLQDDKDIPLFRPDGSKIEIYQAIEVCGKSINIAAPQRHIRVSPEVSQIRRSVMNAAGGRLEGVGVYVLIAGAMLLFLS